MLPTSRRKWLVHVRAKLGDAGATSIERLEDAKRWLSLHDLFYLLVVVLKRADANRDWIFDRCQEVQRAPDGFLDLWAREHYKSTVITFAKTIQDVLIDQETTIGLFSHTRPNAKKFLRQIKNEFEQNAELKRLFPDILWENPRKQAPMWSLDNGLVVRRKSSPKEATLEAWGLDSMPTGAHFRKRIYDDIIDLKHVRNPEMVKKTIEDWEMSLNLGTADGSERYIGTRYAFADPYNEMLRRGSVKPRIYPCTIDGKADGEPVLLTREQVAKKRRDMGLYTFGSQMLQDPTADRQQGFRVEWLRYYQDRNHGVGMNKYLLVDPASSKKAESDYTAMAVIGLAHDENYYLLDAVRDRLNLKERGDALFALHRTWRPLGTGYEKYGMQCDIEHLEERMQWENYRFDITPLGGSEAKHDRIRKLVPVFEANRFYLPEQLLKTDWEGKSIDLTASFVNDEYTAFPVGLHEDLFDAIARILDKELNPIWPKIAQPSPAIDRYARKPRPRHTGSSWAA